MKFTSRQPTQTAIRARRNQYGLYDVVDEVKAMFECRGERRPSWLVEATAWGVTRYERLTIVG